MREQDLTAVLKSFWANLANSFSAKLTDDIYNQLVVALHTQRDKIDVESEICFAHALRDSCSSSAKPTQHPADPWIAEHWQDKHVKQVAGDPKLIGRTGKVFDTLFDEKGALHCQIAPPAESLDLRPWFCPAAMLQIQEE